MRVGLEARLEEELHLRVGRRLHVVANSGRYHHNYDRSEHRSDRQKGISYSRQRVSAHYRTDIDDKSSSSLFASLW